MFASFRNRWLIVVASIFGLMAVAGTVNTFAFAVFLKPVSADLEIGRAQWRPACWCRWRSAA